MPVEFVGSLQESSAGLEPANNKPDPAEGTAAHSWGKTFILRWDPPGQPFYRLLCPALTCSKLGVARLGAHGGCWSSSGLGTAVTHPKRSEAAEKHFPGSARLWSSASPLSAALEPNGMCGPQQHPGLWEAALRGHGEGSRVPRHTRGTRG